MNFILAPLLVSASAPAIAAGQTASPPSAPRPAFEINLPLALDGRYLGDMSVRIDGDQVSFGPERFIELLRPELTPENISAITTQIVDGRLTPQSATTPEISVRYNVSSQQIEVTTPLSARTSRVISIAGGTNLGRTPPVQPANFSAFANISVVYEYIWENPSPDQRGSQPIAGLFDIGGRIGGVNGVAFISRQSFDTGPGRTIQRNESTLIYDNMENLWRITAGDIRYRGESFQTLPRLAGVSFERYFGLEPDFVYRPYGQDQFEIERSSIVEIQVNGATIRQIRLDPGRYDLRNLPLTQGSNNIQIVIRDDTGRVRTISTSQFFDFDLLGEGVSDFSVAGGVRSEFRNGSLRYGDGWGISGFYRRGLSRTITASGRGQFDNNGGNIGGGLVWASPIGIWRAQGAISRRDQIGSGFALDLGYRTTGRIDSGRLQWSLELNAQHYSRDFSTLDFVLPPPEQPVQLFSNTLTANFQLSASRWSITTTGQYNKARGGQPDTASALAGINYSLNRRFTLGAFGTYSRIGNRSDVGALFQLTIRLGRNSFTRATYDTAREEASLQYQHSEPLNVGALSYNVGIRRNTETDFASVAGSAFYTGNRFEASLQHDVFSTADLASDERIQSTRASVSTSIVLAGGRVSIGGPVQQSFAIVAPHPSLAGKEIRINPTERGYRARTDFLGSAVVPDLTTYGRVFLYYDVQDLPPGYDLGAGGFTLRPPLYSGYSLVVGSDANYTVLATVRRGEEPLALIGGSLHYLDHPEDPPIPAFTNRNGRLAATGLRPGRYRLELLTDPPFSTEIEIPTDGSNLVNLGEIRIPE